MNEQTRQVLSRVNFETIEIIARAVLEDASASPIGEPQFDEITASHGDRRTIGIVKVSGDAMSEGTTKRWSAIAKIIDPNAIGREDDSRGDITLDNEWAVYGLRLFMEDGLPMRPAKCYLTQRVHDRYRILWLEDLSHAPQPPWEYEHFVNAANHLGQFAGFHMANGTRVPLEMQSDWYLSRFSAEQAFAGAQSLLDEQGSYQSKIAYRDVPVESAMELAALIGPLYSRGQDAPHCLSFGDSHSRNMFPLDHTTVAIDWGFIGSEPIGADVGVLIGSSLTYSTHEAQLVAASERAIYDSYIAGLKTTGWNGDEYLIRIGFFCQFAHYLSAVSALPASLQNFSDRRAWIEGRFGVPFDDVPAQLAPVIALIPRYVEELKSLLD